MFQILSTFFVLVIFSGCTWVHDTFFDHPPIEPIEVKIPIKCILPAPKVPCSLADKNNAEFIAELARCYKDLELRSKACE